MDSARQTEPDTVEYWKKQAKYYEQKANDIQQELDEYTENSAQLEKELEASLVQVEKQNRDLEHQNQRLKNEIEMLRSKLERCQHETNALENELQTLNIEKEKQAAYIRELEQKNDDLERGQRIISESVSCIETLLNQAYERNAVLESEVDEIENLRVRLQRATDEARDLKQELKVLEKVPTHKKEDGTMDEGPAINGFIPNSTRAHVETETQTVLSTPLKREINGNAMLPSSRVSAMDLVGDILRRVGLERFLCRDCGKVKCSCDALAETDHAAAPGTDNALPDTAEPSLESQNVEYRNTSDVRCRNPGLDAIVDRTSPSRNRLSEQPFVRSSPNNGKLRRSFAVRSREGLENLFGLSSKKKQEFGINQSTTKNDISTKSDPHQRLA